MSVQADFEAFMKRRERAGQSYVSGDAEPILALTTEREPSTFFGPDGGSVRGAQEVRTSHEQGATNFGPSSDSHFEIHAMEASGDLAYWTGFQVANIEVRDSGKIVPMRLRITEAFRREDGEWELVHRHADPAKT